MNEFLRKITLRRGKMGRNYSIKCDVRKCSHNAEGCNCSLDCVKISCKDGACTCCESYDECENC